MAKRLEINLSKCFVEADDEEKSAFWGKVLEEAFKIADRGDWVWEIIHPIPYLKNLASYFKGSQLYQMIADDTKNVVLVISAITQFELSQREDKHGLTILTPANDWSIEISSRSIFAIPGFEELADDPDCRTIRFTSEEVILTFVQPQDDSKPIEVHQLYKEPVNQALERLVRLEHEKQYHMCSWAGLEQLAMNYYIAIKPHLTK